MGFNADYDFNEVFGSYYSLQNTKCLRWDNLAIRLIMGNSFRLLIADIHSLEFSKFANVMPLSSSCSCLQPYQSYQLDEL